MTTEADTLESLQTAAKTGATACPTAVLSAFSSADGPLPPLTLRSYLALSSIASPYLTGDEPTPEHALAACLILRDPRYGLAAYRARTTIACAAAAFSNSTPAELLACLIRRLNEAFAPIPTDIPSDADLRPPGTGWWLAVLEGLMADYGMSLDAALDTPLSIAFCLRAAAAERSGYPLPGASFCERDILHHIHGAQNQDHNNPKHPHPGKI